MIKVFFRCEKDARIIYEWLCARQSALLYWDQCFQLVEPKLLTIDPSSNHEIVIEKLVIPVLKDYVLMYKEQEIMTSMLQEMFFYKDEEERSQIMAMIHSIMDGEREGIPKKSFFQSKEELITDSLQRFIIGNITFTFESFMQFRLKEYVKRLTYYVELGIDEYKLEQDYQELLEQLRHVAARQSPKASCIHIVYDEQFYLYDEQFLEIQEEQKKRYREELISSHQTLYIDEHVIQPLLAIAPSHIYIYTDSPSQSILFTIQNIFQEKVTIRPKKNFDLACKNKYGQEVDF
ncbi:MAG TPA: putative sporulation protein YtxC [Bacillus sp. (in: firmicutes)]|nr:putative sporulation protein YtxC [Bacillus sp. (in: firmicutes)]